MMPESNVETIPQDIDHGLVSRNLPKSTAVIEYISIGIHDSEAIQAIASSQWKPDKSIGIVFPDSAIVPIMVDLGEAELIDQIIAEIRASRSGATGQGVRKNPI